MLLIRLRQSAGSRTLWTRFRPSRLSTPTFRCCILSISEHIARLPRKRSSSQIYRLFESARHLSPRLSMPVEIRVLAPTPLARWPLHAAERRAHWSVHAAERRSRRPVLAAGAAASACACPGAALRSFAKADACHTGPFFPPVYSGARGRKRSHHRAASQVGPLSPLPRRGRRP